MPMMTREELLAAITASRFAAVSIDTTVFDSKQRNFRNTALRSLSQFKEGQVRLIIADVIASEMRAHLEEEATKTQRELKSVLRRHNLRWHRIQPTDEIQALSLDKSPREFARDEFDMFANHVGAEVVRVAEAPDAMSELFSRYFDASPPFGKADSRKHEFPDAAALLRLEAYAQQLKTLVLCVAQDKAWEEFAESSEHLVVAFPLEVVLALFSEAAARQDLANEIVRIWKAGEDAEFSQHVIDAIAERLELSDFEVEADSGPLFEAEPHDAALLEIDLESLTRPLVLAATDTSVTFSINIRVTAEFYASFEFYVLDSKDGDEVALGSETARTTDDIVLTLTIIAQRDVSSGIDYEEVEVSYKPFTIDFGYVEAFPDEDPTHEKY